MDSNQKVKDLDVLLKELGYVDSEGKLTESGADALVRFVPIPEELKEGLTIGDIDDYHISLECEKSFDEEGKVDTQFNPNGSIENIAGITNKTRNVFGMMPHPERCSDEELGNTDGRILFESLLQEISK